MIVILFCTIASLILRYHSETSVAHYLYQEQQQQQQYQRYTRNRNNGLRPLPLLSSSKFVNPFRNYDHDSLNSNAYGSAPIPKNIDEMIHDQMPPIPAVYANLADLNQDFLQQQTQSESENEHGDENDHENTDGKQHERVVPFFWHIPRTGGVTLSQAFGECLDLTLASSASSVPSSSRSMDSFQQIFLDQNQQSVAVLRHGEGKYLNVDLATDNGIVRANKLRILQQQKNEDNDATERTQRRLLVDVVISPLLYDTSKILFAPPDHLSASNPTLLPKGQLFTMLRHPVEREVSYFYYLQQGGDFLEMSISDWVTSTSFLDNFMVRSLVNKFDRSYKITIEDLLVSKEVLRRKCLVGLLEEKGSSWRRMKKYFGASWDHQLQQYHGGGGSRGGCEQKLLFWGWCNRNSHRPYVGHDVDGNGNNNGNGYGGTGFTINQKEEVVDRASYEQIETINRWDVILYEYAKYVFSQQGVWLGVDVVDVIENEDEDEEALEQSEDKTDIQSLDK